MDDPWDVKSVRQSGQYISCMKINGVPLLPPLLSKECRTEMQYYKLLAKEVEKRISVLQPYIESEVESMEDRTITTDTPECEEFELDETATNDHDNSEKMSSQKSLHDTLTNPILHPELFNLSSKEMDIVDKVSPQFLLDFSVDLDETEKKIKDDLKNDSPTSPIELPERDYNCTKELLTDVETNNHNKQKKEAIVEEIVNFSFTLARETSLDSSRESFNREGPQSLSSKSFTGSLNDLHLQNDKGVNVDSKLVRQSSYTILNPSPQLLAHLEVQSLNLGVDMSTISMSESLSNLTPSKKRRSWDLELAKVKWSNMAMELKEKNLTKPNAKINRVKGHTIKETSSPTRAASVAAARTKYANLCAKPTPKTEPIVKTRAFSPVRDTPSDRTIILEERNSFKLGKESKSGKLAKELTSPKILNHKKAASEPLNPPKDLVKTAANKKELQSHKPPTPNPQLTSDENGTPIKPPLISQSDDPAAKVRELYEKIQKQQQMQMASLVEKQKREQIMLQQAFEEQNNLLFKQLKTICPESPDSIREAWGDKMDPDRGPVSLSQLIDAKTNHTSDSPVSSTLTNSSKYINHCNSVLKRSRDISSSIKRVENSPNQNGKAQSAKALEGRVRASSPTRKGTTSRRLEYETSASSERDYEPILTDRTNDTLADLNVTFPSDSEDSRPGFALCQPAVTVLQNSTPAQLTDCAITCMEQTIQKSITGSRALRNRTLVTQPTAKQITAACYTLHDTFIASSPAERCAMISADRSRCASLASRPPPRHHANIQQ